MSIKIERSIKSFKVSRKITKTLEYLDETIKEGVSEEAIRVEIEKYLNNPMYEEEVKYNEGRVGKLIKKDIEINIEEIK